MKNLETKACFDKTLTDEEFGEGASKCFTLFHWFWDKCYATVPVNKTFVKALEDQERKMRKMCP